MPVGCYKHISTIKEGAIMRLQCISTITLIDGAKSASKPHQEHLRMNEFETTCIIHFPERVNRL